MFTLKQYAALFRRRIMERGRIIFRDLTSKLAILRTPCILGCIGESPSVTIFISSFNTRDPLELTLLSLIRSTTYPNCRLLIAENASTDGSAEFVRQFKCRYPVQILEADKPRSHSIWLDEVARTVQTKYWFAVDSDMLFFEVDVITEMVSRLEADQSLYLLGSEYQPPGLGVEPVGHRLVRFGERAGTWLIALRTELRDAIDVSFAFLAVENPATGVPETWDVGGYLLHKMSGASLRYGFMPSSFRRAYYHFGSLSWAVSGNPGVVYSLGKARQAAFIARRLQRLRSMVKTCKS